MGNYTCRVCAASLSGRLRSFCSPQCKATSEKARSRARYLSDVEGRKRQSREWKLANPERAKQLAREYAIRNRDKTRDRERDYFIANRARYSQHARQWYWRNRDKARGLGRLNAAARRARMAHNGQFELTERDLRRALYRCNGMCVYCKSPLTHVHWDHVVPIARGGSHGIGNLVPACPPCNQAKSDRTLMEWRIRMARNV